MFQDRDKWPEESTLLGSPADWPIAHDPAERRVSMHPCETVIRCGDLICRGDSVKLDINLKK